MACYDRFAAGLTPPLRECGETASAFGRVTRRQAFGRGLGLGLTLYASKLLTLDRALEAAQAQAAPDAPVLVSVFLPGGCDLLGALPPVAQLGRLNDLRHTVPPGDVPALPGESRLAIHPALTRGLNGGVAGLFGAGKVGLLPGIDYAPPDQSHFHSRHFWETGIVNEAAGPGWLGRWLDRHGSRDNPLQGLSVDGSLSPVLRTVSAPVAALDSTADASLTFGGTWGIGAERADAAWAKLAALPRHGAGPVAAGRAAALAQQVGRLLAPYSEEAAAPVAYPRDSDFAGHLRHLAGLLSLPLGIRMATVDAPGDFDTHDDQPRELADALGEVSEGVAAGQAGLEARGIADRVLTFVWSEFGRRPRSNDSAGTDHGAGGIAWVQGTRAAPGVLSEVPDLGVLDRNDNLAVTVDFRRVYASLLEQWLGTDAAEVLPDAARAGRLQVVR